MHFKQPADAPCWSSGKHVLKGGLGHVTEDENPPALPENWSKEGLGSQTPASVRSKVRQFYSNTEAFRMQRRSPPNRKLCVLLPYAKGERNKRESEG